MVWQQRVITPVVWLEAPDWLTIEDACYLTGWDAAAMQEIISEGGVDLNDEGLIAKDSLYEFQEALLLVVHWWD
ncbi:MAG: hypothetical protein GX601_20510 [Anaerolineales bacterium]|nr:hypothetical protein [Anaerolineales bacterium]